MTRQQILDVLLFVAAAGAAVTALRYLARSMMEGRRWWFGRLQEKRERDKILATLTNTEVWPNGSKSLPESHINLYNRASSIDERTEEMAKDIGDIKVVLAEVSHEIENTILPIIRGGTSPTSVDS